VKGCVFAPYFGSDEGAAQFAVVHKIFGASNVSKLLLHIPMSERCDAVVTISYEAQARLRDPVFGCVAHIYALQQQVASLQADLAFMQAQLANRVSAGSAIASAICPVMSASSYSQNPHQVPAHLSMPYHLIPQPYNARVLGVKEENACGFANSMDCEFSISPNDNSSPQMEVLQRCRNLEKTGEDSEELEALAQALLLRG
jgi:hypothetical protein